MQVNELDYEDKYYTIEIKERKSKRSVESNRMMWALLGELEKVTRETAMDWYIKALQDCNIKCEYLWATEQAEKGLQAQFRAVQRIKPHKIGGSDGWLYKVFIGSSKFTTAEMTELIETVLRYCEEHYIDTGVI